MRIGRRIGRYVGYKEGVFHDGTIVDLFVPPEDLDISGRGYTSFQIDDYLIYHADVLGTNNTEMDIRGNDNPTIVSADARQTLYDNFVLVNYNAGYTP